MLNGKEVAVHDGGYSTFRANVTDVLTAENDLLVEVDNSVNNRVYPQKADFTFYGGIYRDVYLVVLNKHHFDMDFFGGPGIAVNPTVLGNDSPVQVRTWHNAPNAVVDIVFKDAEGNVVASQTGADTDTTLVIENVHLWDGIEDPYLYTAKAEFGGDEVSTRFGCRTIEFDADKGFLLNGRVYPLRGVSRHQDRKGLGNALTINEHREDMDFIREIGANTVRLAHYQHAQEFYDLCDEYGIIAWAEIPYITAHMPNGRENTLSQMRELITQCYNHPINAKADEIEGYVSQIIRASKDDFLDLAVTVDEFYLSELVSKLTLYYRDKLETIKTDFQVGSFGNCLLKGDPERSIEVLQNLMENAIKYGDGEQIHIRFSEEDGCILICVCNTGCTLPAAELPHVFDSFWRGSNADSHPGSGLGLYICRQLMHKMNGDIFAQIKDECMMVTAVFLKA